MPELKKILYPHTWDPDDVNAWSGTTKWLKDNLSACGIEVIPAILTRATLPRIRNKVSLLLTGKRHLSSHSVMEAEHLGRQVDRLALDHKPDLILSTSSLPISRCRADVAKAFLTDATIHLLSQYYDRADNLSPSSQKEADRVEGDALHNADAVFYPSEWAKDSAVNHYGTDPSKVHVVPLGANLPSVPDRDFVLNAIQNRPKSLITFLFIGNVWKRKGGDKAIEIVAELRRRGLDARLELMGGEAPEGIELPDFVSTHGFVDKKTDEGRRRFGEILSTSHFMLLPTMAECAGLVFAEASAFGLPSITHSVHGVPGMVTDGRNGIMKDVSTSPTEFADLIEATLADWSSYESLSRSAREMFEAELNWTSVTDRMLAILEPVVARRRST